MPQTSLLWVRRTEPGQYASDPAHQNEDAVLTMLGRSDIEVPSGSYSQQRQSYGDSAACLKNEIETPETGFLVAVLDGMSNGGFGVLAVKAAKQAIQTAWSQLDHRQPLTVDPPLLIYHLMQLAHDQVCEHLGGQFGGTTCLIAHFYGNLLTFGHVGDCRLYCVRRGNTQLITMDQTALYRTRIGKDLQHKAQNGRLSRVDQDRYDEFENSLTRFLGHPDLPSNPERWVEIGQLELERNDLFLICSDGVLKRTEIGGIGVEDQPWRSIDTIAEEQADAWLTQLIESAPDDRDDITFCVIGVRSWSEEVRPNTPLSLYSARYVLELKEDGEEKQSPTAKREARTTSKDARVVARTTVPIEKGDIQGVSTKQIDERGGMIIPRPSPRRSWGLPLLNIFLACAVLFLLIRVLREGGQHVVGGATTATEGSAVAIAVTRRPTGPNVSPPASPVENNPTPLSTRGVEPAMAVSPPPSPTPVITTSTAPVYAVFDYPALNRDNYADGATFLRETIGISSQDSTFKTYTESHQQYEPTSCTGQPAKPSVWSCLTTGIGIPGMIPIHPWFVYTGIVQTTITNTNSFSVTIDAGAANKIINVNPPLSLPQNTLISILGVAESDYMTGKTSWTNLKTQDGLPAITPYFIRIKLPNDPTEPWRALKQDPKLFDQPVWLYVNDRYLLRELIGDDPEPKLQDAIKPGTSLLIQGSWDKQQSTVTPRISVGAVYQLDGQRFVCKYGQSFPNSNATCP